MSHEPNSNPHDVPPAAAKAPGASAVSGPIVERLNELLGERTFAEIARATGCNSETVRRYMRGGQPSVAFVVAVARHYRVSLDWLLLGEEPRNGRGVAGAGASIAQDHPRPPQGLHAPDTVRSGQRDPARPGDGRDSCGVFVRGISPGGALREGA